MSKRKDKGKQREDDIIPSSQEVKIHSDTKTLIKDLPSIIKEGIKKPGNILNLSIIGFAAVCNAILAHTSLTVSFILAGISCLQPAVTDFGYNYKLIKNELLKNKDIKTLQDKALEITKFIWPGIVAVVVGALFFGLHIRLYNQGAEVVSSVLLAVGTFVAGSVQMLVKPMIKREMARRNPPAPMVGEREILISPAIQAAEELEQEVANTILNQKVEELSKLITAQNSKFLTKTSNIKQTLMEQKTGIDRLNNEKSNLQASNKTFNTRVEELTNDKAQLTEQLEQKQDQIDKLQAELNYLQQPVREKPIHEIGSANINRIKNNNNSQGEISVITR
ncbi:hypothetical protein NOVO_06765 [Rickettsiales bacterium Ac37b]|nr:hypothetical protein NOVO_06765 [Rickettsiales bacterium Ac37b]